MNRLTKLHKDEAGQGLVEYILIVVVMGLLAVTAIRRLATSTQAGFTKASTDLTNALNGE